MNSSDVQTNTLVEQLNRETAIIVTVLNVMVEGMSPLYLNETWMANLTLKGGARAMLDQIIQYTKSGARIIL